MNLKSIAATFLVSVAGMIVEAQSPTNHRETAPIISPQYWIDPSTGLMWAHKDNGKDVNWHEAMSYCLNLQLAGFSDWRLPTIDELRGIYDENAHAPGLEHKETSDRHVKGGLFLTGQEWSISKRMDAWGHTSGLVWYFDFINGRQNNEDAGRFSGHYVRDRFRALCVRHP